MIPILRDSWQDATSSTTNGTSITASYPVVPAKGKLLVSAAMLSTTAVNVAKPSGWTTLTSLDNSSFAVFICAKIAGDGESQNVNFNMSGQSNGDVYVALAQYPFPAPISPFDKATSATDFVFGATEATGTTATTTAVDELVFSVMGFGGATSAASWSKSTLVHNMDKLVTGQQFVSNIATYSDTATWTNSSYAVGAIATIKLQRPRRAVARRFRAK